MNESIVGFVRELAVDPSRSSASDPERRQAALELRQQLRSKAMHSSKRKQVVKKKVTRRKEVLRFSSPSHFLVDPAQENHYGAEHELDLPDRERVDTLLRGVAVTFYPRRAVTSTQPGMVAVDQEYDLHQYTTFDRLRSALRRPRPGEDWTPREVALFEAGICLHGKDFSAIRHLVSSKELSEVVAFYYRVFKKSAHYRIWKANASLANSVASSVTLPSFSGPPSSVNATPAPSSSIPLSSSSRPASSSSSPPPSLSSLDMARRASPRLRPPPQS